MSNTEENLKNFDETVEETINEKERSNSYHPYFEIFVGKYTDPVVMLQLALMLYNFYIIYKRQTTPIFS